jgi:hypothetical protein
MSRGDPHWSEPKWVRSSVRHEGNHLGSVTTVSYPNRDLTAFPEGSPYFEIVIADLAEYHVALLQRFKEHWLIHCGNSYITSVARGVLTADQIDDLAVFALQRQSDSPSVLAAAIEAQVEELLVPKPEQPK